MGELESTIDYFPLPSRNKMKAWKSTVEETLEADYKAHSFNTGKENTLFNNT